MLNFLLSKYIKEKYIVLFFSPKDSIFAYPKGILSFGNWHRKEKSIFETQKFFGNISFIFFDFIFPFIFYLSLWIILVIFMSLIILFNSNKEVFFYLLLKENSYLFIPTYSSITTETIWILGSFIISIYISILNFVGTL